MLLLKDNSPKYGIRVKKNVKIWNKQCDISREKFSFKEGNSHGFVCHVAQFVIIPVWDIDNMPRRREEEVFDEYDARAYAHLVPNSSETMTQFSKKHEKRKKSKQKSHKRPKERGDREKKKEREREDDSSTAVAVFGRTNIVDYEDVSSDSGDLSDPSLGANSRVSGHPSSSASAGKRAESPASAIRSYIKERSHSPSPVIHESSPYNRTERSARKSKKRPRERSPLEPLPKLKYIEQSPPKTKQYVNPPRAYAADPPRAYAEVSSKYSGAFRNYSPPGTKKRYRSRSPTSPFGRRKSRSRSRYNYHISEHFEASY